MFSCYLGPVCSVFSFLYKFFLSFMCRGIWRVLTYPLRMLKLWIIGDGKLLRKPGLPGKWPMAIKMMCLCVFFLV